MYRDGYIKVDGTVHEGKSGACSKAVRSKRDADAEGANTDAPPGTCISAIIIRDHPLFPGRKSSLAQQSPAQASVSIMAPTQLELQQELTQCFEREFELRTEASDGQREIAGLIKELQTAQERMHGIMVQMYEIEQCKTVRIGRGLH